MNYFKWVTCWWNKRHVFCKFHTKDATMKRQCIKCGFEQDY